MVAVFYAFFIASAVLIAGYLATVALEDFSIPEPIILISVGVLIGPILQLVNPAELSSLAMYLGALAFVAIMFESSLSINVHELASSAKPALALALFSFTFSVSITAAILHYLFKFGLVESLLFGCIVGGSSNAVIAPIIGKLSVDPDLSSIINFESLLTDVFCIVSTVFVKWMMISSSPAREMAGFIASKFSTSVIVGFMLGFFLANIIYKIRKKKHTYIALFASLVFTYALSEFLEGNGAITVLVMGIILSNIERFPSFLSFEDKVEVIKFQRIFFESFHSELTLLIKVFFFVEIGLLFSFKAVEYLPIALLFSAILFLARFPAIYAMSKITGEDTNSLETTAFCARGLVAAVLAVDVFTDRKLIEVGSLTNPTFFLQTIAEIVVITNIILILVHKFSGYLESR